MTRLLTKISYAAPAIPLAALTLPVTIYLPTFYATEMGLSLAAVGLCLLLARFWDGLTDPIVGVLSDHTNGWIGRNIGKRTVWIMAGLIPTMVATWFLLAPSSDSVGVVYLTVWSCVLYAGWTCMIIPLNALGAELSDDYNERTKITAWRESFTMVGVMAALTLIALLSYGASGDQSASALLLIAIFVIIALPLSMIIFWFGVKETEAKPAKKLGFKKATTILKNNAPFRRLIIAYLINGTANAIPATLFLLFVQYHVELEDFTGLFLFCYFIAGVIGVPFWTWVSHKTSKHRAWCASILFACAIFCTVPFVVQAGDFYIFLAICLLTGLSVGADLALPASIQADVIDVDRIASGNERAGLYFALWGMATKLALALAAGLFLPLLQATGFNAEDGGDTSALPYFYALIPVALKIMAVLIMWSYPLTSERVNQLRSRDVTMT